MVESVELHKQKAFMARFKAKVDELSAAVDHILNKASVGAVSSLGATTYTDAQQVFDEMPSNKEPTITTVLHFTVSDVLYLLCSSEQKVAIPTKCSTSTLATSAMPLTDLVEAADQVFQEISCMLVDSKAHKLDEMDMKVFYSSEEFITIIPITHIIDGIAGKVQNPTAEMKVCNVFTRRLLCARNVFSP
uniref:Uncharacterized protein n=1 Tax=Oryza nivara TaxID=4536 RepID=A0A0E0J214_ORYNI